MAANYFLVVSGEKMGLRVKYVPAGCYNTLCVSLRVKYVPVMVQLSFIGQGL